MDAARVSANRPHKGTFHYRLGQLSALIRHLAGRRTDGRVSPARQLFEILYLWIRGSLGPLSYFRLGLFRSSLPWHEKKQFVGEVWYRRRIDRVNLPQHRIVAWNKVVSHGLLEQFGVRMAPFYGVADPAGGRTFDGAPLRSAGDLDTLIRRAAIDGMVFKLIAGNSGRGFLKVAFERDNGHTDAVIQPDAPRTNLDDFWREHVEPAADRSRKGFGYLCEGIVEQHPDVAAFHPGSINTARVWMVRRRPGEWEMFGALLRIGVGNNAVDNSDRGGIGAPIDVETGRLRRAVRHGLDYHEGYDFGTFDTHPTTGRPITGTVLPMWDRMLPFCQSVCAVFPWFRLMGLDVAFAPDGLVVIEVEADPHPTHQTYMERGIRDLMEELARVT